ncbi:hypothetical protein H0H87_005767 [Tephrocybe sp. NHM501043]|nr:hypothetical protein H0H87_005767 [Tephrocybe sp. NHM501043]
MRLVKLNDSRKLLGMATTLDDHKQWILAVASGRVDHVGALVQAAVDKLYKPKGYTEDDIMRSIVMLCLGGARVAEFAHLAFSSPSVTTARRNAIIVPLLISHAKPTILEVELNISAFLDALPGGKTADHDGTIRRTCFLASAESMPIMFLLSLAPNVSWIFSVTPLIVERYISLLRLLARPIVVSGTCKRETGPEHAKVIETVISALERKNSWGNTTFRTISIGSDGEAKRGDALTIVTMHSTLKSSSPIYPLLFNLKFMNFLVGSDDITADKDYKHIFKRICNLLMRNKGFEIQGYCVTPASLKLHLQSNGVSQARLHSLLNPNDRQDVVLGYQLLSKIWRLPLAPANATPGFSRTREALQLFGAFAHHLIIPYICVDLSLDKQLIHLSAAAHMAMYFYTDDLARTRFMPNQTYVDIMIMIKNAYFCVAKTKIDNPNDSFYLILLGTDRLETLFGLIRTAVGTDSNVDVMQLGSRASGLVEVGVILSIHPEWDHGKRRMKLPVITKEQGEIDSKTDHISPASCCGNLCVATVNLCTCWIVGRQKAVGHIPHAEASFQRLSVALDVDILSPLGSLLVNQRDLDDEYNCSDLEREYPAAGEEELAPGPSATPSSCKPQEAPYTHVGDMEDTMAEEAPHNQNVTAKVTVKGVETTKPKALHERMLYRTHRASTDCLKRVQNTPCFSTSTPANANIISFDS